MKKPRFKLDGRTGQLRYFDAEGRKQVQAGRVGILWHEYLLKVVAGVVQGAEIRKRGADGLTQWYALEATPEEAEEVLAEHTKKLPDHRIISARAIRRHRERTGKPVV